MNSVKIVRRPKIPGRFMQIDYNLLWNDKLSSNAKIIMFTTLSYKDGFKFTKNQIQEKTGIPSSTFDREWKKLRDLGYIETNHLGHRNWEIIVNEEPCYGPKMGLCIDPPK